MDRDLAAIYGVKTGRLNEAVKRNVDRFPGDFMFQLTREEVESLRSQIAILKTGRGSHVKFLPYAFTEHGAIQAANVLNSPRAVTMGIHVVRAFIQYPDQVSISLQSLHRESRGSSIDRARSVMPRSSSSCGIAHGRSSQGVGCR